MVKIVEIKAATSKANKKNKQNKQRNVRPHNVGLQDVRMVLAPVAKSLITTSRQPSFSGARAGGAVRVSHREYIADINGTASFSVTQGSINPSLSGLFPWLSQFGLAYESYSFNRLRFVVEPIAATSSAGQMMLAIDYDSADAAPTTKTEILQYKGCVAGPVWNMLTCTATGKDESALGKRRFVRAGDLSANQDVKTYDVGNFFIASQGTASTIAASALFVEYDVEFFTPQYSLTAFANAYSRKITGSGSVSRTAPFGTAAVTLGGLAVSALNGTLTFDKVGQYLVQAAVAGTTVTSTQPTLTAGTGLTITTVGGVGNPAATDGMYEWVVNVLNKGATLVTDFTPSAATITGAVVRVAPYLVSML